MRKKTAWTVRVKKYHAGIFAALFSLPSDPLADNHMRVSSIHFDLCSELNIYPISKNL